MILLIILLLYQQQYQFIHTGMYSSSAQTAETAELLSAERKAILGRYSSSSRVQSFVNHCCCVYAYTCFPRRGDSVMTTNPPGRTGSSQPQNGLFILQTQPPTIIVWQLRRSRLLIGPLNLIYCCNSNANNIIIRCRHICTTAGVLVYFRSAACIIHVYTLQQNSSSIA